MIGPPDALPLAKLKKIHITGGPGSGKTTLAGRLCASLSLPHIDLDPVAWEPQGAVPLLVRKKRVESILASAGWITEGIFLWWTEPLMESAQAIIWLDLPFRVAAWRILRRHTLASLRGNNPHPGLGQLMRFLTSAGRQYHTRQPVPPSTPDDDFAVTRAATSQVLVRYRHKLIHCRTSDGVRRLEECFVK